MTKRKTLATTPKHIADFIGKADLVPVRELAKLPIEQRMSHAARGQHLELAGKLYAGYALMGLKEELGHGRYMAALAEAGVTREDARRSVNLVKLAERVSPANYTTLRNLSPSKHALMAQWDDDELTAFFAGETVHGITLEDAQTCSFRELALRIKEADTHDARKQINALESDKKNLKARLDLKEREIRQMREQRVERTQPYPEFVAAARRESNALAEKARLCLDDLTQIHADHIALYVTQKGDPRAMEYWETAAAAIYFNARAVVAQAETLIRKLESDLPESVTGEVTVAHFYSDDDIRQALADHELLVQLHEHERLLRQPQDTRRKVGRPRKGVK